MGCLSPVTSITEAEVDSDAGDKWLSLLLSIPSSSELSLSDSSYIKMK